MTKVASGLFTIHKRGVYGRHGNSYINKTEPPPIPQARECLAGVGGGRFMEECRNIYRKGIFASSSKSLYPKPPKIRKCFN